MLFALFVTAVAAQCKDLLTEKADFSQLAAGTLPAFCVPGMPGTSLKLGKFDQNTLVTQALSGDGKVIIPAEYVSAGATVKLDCSVPINK